MSLDADPSALVPILSDGSTPRRGRPRGPVRRVAGVIGPIITPIWEIPIGWPIAVLLQWRPQRGQDRVDFPLFLAWLLRAAAAGAPTGRKRSRTKPGITRTAVRRRHRVGDVRASHVIAPWAGAVNGEELGQNVLQIRCFGRFEVHCNGRPVQDWRRNKARTLLKYLVDRRHPIPREVMLDLLWPETDIGPASNSLRVTLHALRQALGPIEGIADASREYVVFDGGSFQLNPLVSRWIDVEEFAHSFAAGFRQERQGRVNAAITHYERCEDLYRDDYLVEDLYEDWTLARREELKDQFLLVITRLADHCLHVGDWHGCIVRCHKILQKDPCREDAYQRLMRSYGQLSQPSQARHWYEVCTRALRRELDITPSEATVQLYEQLVLMRGRAAGRFEPSPERPS